MSPKKTPLFEAHKSLGGKIVDFAGWQMPVQYPEGLKAEHNHVRSEVGLFDVSHMGELRVKGPKSLESLQWLTTNDVSKLTKGRAQYTLLPNHQGGIVDDFIIYCLEPERDYLLCVNAANKDKDFRWITENNKGADITDESAKWGQIAIQGPKAGDLAQKTLGTRGPQKPFGFETLSTNSYGDLILASTGYTGEPGYEVFVPWEKTEKLWRDLLDNGQELNVKPAGLGARDTLRTEMGFSLYGHEINDNTNPYAARLGWVVKPQAKDFIGKGPMLEAKEKAEIKQKIVGFKVLERGIPRQGYKLFSFDNQEIGTVTSGTVSPTLNESIGIAFIHKDYADVGQEFLLEIRSRRVKSCVVDLPFVKPKG